MPTHISFNLDSITPIQAKALGAMLKVFEDGEQPANTASRDLFRRAEYVPCPAGEVDTTNVDFTEAKEQEQAVADVIASFTKAAEELGKVELPEDKPKRTRRTKAEMEAAMKDPSSDEIKFNGFLAVINDQMDAARIDTDKRRNAVKEWEARYAADGTQAIEDIQKAIGLNKDFLAKKVPTPAAEEVKPPTLDELRAIMNGYTTRHDFDMTLALLAKYKCARANSVLDMPLADQLKFVEEANA